MAALVAVCKGLRVPVALVRCPTEVREKTSAELGYGLMRWPEFVLRMSGLVPWCLLPLDCTVDLDCVG